MRNYGIGKEKGTFKKEDNTIINRRTNNAYISKYSKVTKNEKNENVRNIINKNQNNYKYNANNNNKNNNNNYKYNNNTFNKNNPVITNKDNKTIDIDKNNLNNKRINNYRIYKNKDNSNINIIVNNSHKNELLNKKNNKDKTEKNNKNNKNNIKDNNKDNMKYNAKNNNNNNNSVEYDIEEEKENDNKKCNEYFSKITEDSYNRYSNNLFIVFNSINDILTLIYRNEDNSIIAYNINDLNDSKRIIQIKNAHKDDIKSFSYFFDKINKRDIFLSVSGDILKVWNVFDFNCIFELKNERYEECGGFGDCGILVLLVFYSIIIKFILPKFFNVSLEKKIL